MGGAVVRSGRERQTGIFVRGLAGVGPGVPVEPGRLEAAARRRMSREGFAYMAGGAGTERTIENNRSAFDRWRIVPRMLRDVSVRDTSVELFGRRLSAPLLLAPIGVLELAHRGADVAVGRAAAAEGVPAILSSQASYPMEEVARAMDAAGGMGSPRWFQLYWSKSDELVASFVRRAEDCGCEAIVLTLDTTMLGWRARDLDLAYLPFLRGMGIAQYTSDPVFRASLSEPAAGADPTPRPPVNARTLRALAEMAANFPGTVGEKLGALRSGEARAAVARFISTYSRPSLKWDDLSYLRELTDLPILLKGVLHPEDARLAVERGMDGLIVSNHGGRQVDGALGALEALPDIVRTTGGRIPVLFDSGVRTGSDIFKALALGASAVCLGRPYAYGLALGGEAGVREVVQNLLADFDLTLGLAGCRSLDEVTRETLLPAPEESGDG